MATEYGVLTQVLKYVSVSGCGSDYHFQIPSPPSFYSILPLGSEAGSYLMLADLKSTM